MDIVPWILLLLLVFVFALYWKGHNKRRHLSSYVIYLLLNDNIREDHKAQFIDWIRQADAPNPTALSARAGGIIENMADTLAADKNAPSELASLAMLLNVKKGEPVPSD